MLENKRILIISPQSWGKMFIAKHHYAIELTKLRNEVYFLNPPDPSLGKRKVEIKKDENFGINIITYKPFYGSYLLRFKARQVYDFFNNRYIKKILKTLNLNFDVIWCFETNLFNDLRIFGADLKIYHPVDLVLYPYQINPAKNADIILAVSQSILDSFKQFHIPKLLVNHGLNESFAEDANQLLQFGVSKLENKTTIKVGYIGNLINKRFHRKLVEELINKYPEVEFHFWGPQSFRESNIAGDDSHQISEFINRLGTKNNVILHGIKTGKELSSEMRQVDIFLMVTNFDNIDYYDGSNAHKILEYLSTGKVVVSNFFILQYEGTNLVEMPEKNGSDDFLAKFDQVIKNLAIYNSTQNQNKRLQFALDNTYRKQISRIENSLIAIAK